MGIKFKLKLSKEYEIDTAKQWNGDHDTFIEALKDKVGVEPGNEASVDEIHDAIRSMLEDEIEYVVELDIDAMDFEIEIPAGTTFMVPEESEDEDSAA
jgi:hypothetical protein